MHRLDITSLVWDFFVREMRKSSSLLETLTNAAATSEQKRVSRRKGEKIWIEDGKDNGCIINTAIQAASEPNQLSICVNKANYTHDMNCFMMSIHRINMIGLI